MSKQIVYADLEYRAYKIKVSGIGHPYRFNITGKKLCTEATIDFLCGKLQYDKSLPKEVKEVISMFYLTFMSNFHLSTQNVRKKNILRSKFNAEETLNAETTVTILPEDSFIIQYPHGKGPVILRTGNARFTKLPLRASVGHHELGRIYIDNSRFVY